MLVSSVLWSLLAYFDLNSATNAVFPPLLQPAINSAAANDTLILWPGSYLDTNLTFNVPLTVLAANTNRIVHLVGSVQVKGVGTWRFQNINFASTVDIQSTGTISAVGCYFGLPVTSSNSTLQSLSNTFVQSLTVDLTVGIDTNLQLYDTTFAIITVNGGKSLLKRCTSTGTDGNDHAIILNDAALDLIRSTNRYGILSRSTTGKSVPIRLIQCILGTGDPGHGNLDLYSNEVWLGYNRISGRVYGVGTRSIMIGNIVSTPIVNTSAVQLDGGSNLRAYNNIFSCYNYYTLLSSDSNIALYNTTIYSFSGSAVSAGGSNSFFMRGVAANGDVGGGANIRWDVSDCAFTKSSVSKAPFGSDGGCYDCDLGLFNPQIGSINPLDFIPKTNSILIGLGPSEVAFDNRGTTNRNDIGYTGGPFYNPANLTNSAPNVYLLTGTPQLFFKGFTNIISVNAAAVAGD